MKKLMFAVAAIAAGAAMAEGITSSNIVGFKKDALVVGQQALGAQFLGIGTNGCYLSEIKVDVTKTLGTVTIQLIGTKGESLKTYKYWKGGAGGFKTEGWYVGSTTTRVTKDNDVFFAAGTGLWVKGIANSGLTSSGEVLLQDISLPLIAGQQLLANPFPADTKLTKISVDVTKTLGTVTIQLLGTKGESVKTYKYWKGGAGGFKTEGWYVGSTTTRVTEDADVTLAGGTGLWVKGVAGATMIFKKPF